MLLIRFRRKLERATKDLNLDTLVKVQDDAGRIYSVKEFTSERSEGGITTLWIKVEED